MNEFISCDWGTSAFRLRLIDTLTKNVLAEVKANMGIAATYAAWKESGENDRVCFYSSFLAVQVKALEQQCHSKLDNTAIVMSGMVSSNIGMIDLPYKELPFFTSGSDTLTHLIPPSEQLKNKMIILSGARTNEDVMRGEETKLIGCETADEKDEQLFIMPGTHCKHIVVQDRMATRFKTFMTGEVFNLLTTKSILAASVEKNKAEQSIEAITSFTEGVLEGASNNLLNSIFHVRTNKLFDYYTAKDNYNYLSGLLIGSELKDLAQKDYAHITLVANGSLAFYYLQALQTLGVTTNVHTIDSDKALVAGQRRIYMQQ